MTSRVERAVGLGGLGEWLEGDLVAEAFELFDEPGLVIKRRAPAGAGARKRPPEQRECGLLMLVSRPQEDHPYGEA
jgi:hypothetical protein